jgi:hypothetical protein
VERARRYRHRGVGRAGAGAARLAQGFREEER